MARLILQQSLRADTAILLPSIGPVDEHKLFFVVANIQQRGAEIIDKRILEQLRRDREFQSDNFTVTVSHVFLSPMSRVSERIDGNIGRTRGCRSAGSNQHCRLLTGSNLAMSQEVAVTRVLRVQARSALSSRG